MVMPLVMMRVTAENGAVITSAVPGFPLKDTLRAATLVSALDFLDGIFT